MEEIMTTKIQLADLSPEERQLARGILGDLWAEGTSSACPS
jgi:hypothetical protein